MPRRAFYFPSKDDLEHILGSCCHARQQKTKVGRGMMSERTSLGTQSHATTRRQMIVGAAVAFGSLAAGHHIWGKTQQQDMKQTPRTTANAKRTSLHLELDYKASPQRIYEALLDSKQFTAFSGMPAEIDPKGGGAFSMFGGMIVGRNVELIPNQRIVQAWRPTHWDPGVYSIVRFELKTHDSGTMLVLDHTGFPEGEFDHLEWGWHNHYGDPLKKFLV
jgi:activator of HSP90 ATPase